MASEEDELEYAPIIPVTMESVTPPCPVPYEDWASTPEFYEDFCFNEPERELMFELADDREFGLGREDYDLLIRHSADFDE